MILTGRSVRTGASLRHLVAIKAQEGRVGRTNMNVTTIFMLKICTLWILLVKNKKRVAHELNSRALAGLKTCLCGS